MSGVIVMPGSSRLSPVIQPLFSSQGIRTSGSDLQGRHFRGHGHVGAVHVVPRQCHTAQGHVGVMVRSRGARPRLASPARPGGHDSSREGSSPNGEDAPPRSSPAGRLREAANHPPSRRIEPGPAKPDVPSSIRSSGRPRSKPPHHRYRSGKNPWNLKAETIRQ